MKRSDRILLTVLSGAAALGGTAATFATFIPARPLPYEAAIASACAAFIVMVIVGSVLAVLAKTGDRHR